MILVALFAAACTEPADDATASFAVDVDHSGSLDCADLDHLLACLAHPDPHQCAADDVNHDGVVDDTDAHDLHDGLAATGHHCAPPPDHTPHG